MELELETHPNLICRTCKCVAPRMWPLFEGYENPHQSPRIDEMLMACASVQVMCGDGLPAQICQVCVEQLRNAFIFKRQCEKIDASLREYAKDIKVSEIKEELQNSDFMESLNTLSSLINEQTSVKETNAETFIAAVVPKIETDYIQLMDNDQLLLTCCECTKIFTTIKGLRSHKLVHSRSMYKCSQCDKEYTKMGHLKRHLATHLRNKPFSCNTCNKVFSRVENLNNHIPKCKRDIVYTYEDSLEVYKKMHDTETKLSTVENLDNIEDYYYQIDQDDDSVFSKHSDVNDCFQNQVEVMGDMDDNGAHIGLNDDDSSVSKTVMDNDSVNDIGVAVDKPADGLENVKEEDLTEMKVEYTLETEDNILDLPAIDFGNSKPEDSNDSDYLQQRSVSPKIKRNHGKPCKNPLASEKMKTPSRDLRIKRIKTEPMDEEHGEYSCPSSQEMFNSTSAVDKHAETKHEGLKVYKCDVCNKEFSRIDQLREHVSSHLDYKLLPSNMCTENFNRRDHLNQHQKLHESSDDFECDICQKAFNWAVDLKKHKALKHGIGEKIMNEKRFECPLCDKSFITKKSRDIHVNGHNGQKEYTCNICHKTFLSKYHLTKHIKLHNEDSKKFVCSECGQRFTRNDYLVIHMRRHSGEKPFKCKFCGKGFPRTTDLKVHERHHTGEKTHLCTICGRGFGRSYNLTLHMRTHTGEKPYQCTYCDAAFAQGNDLKTHVRQHTGERFECELCSDKFVRVNRLTHHKRIVHGLNPSTSPASPVP